MKNEPNWVDYSTLASSAIQNIQLNEVNAKLDSLAQVERIKLSKTEFQKNIRNALWKYTQLLESAKKECAGDSLQLALHLHMCTPPLSPEQCEDWEDKIRLQSFLDEVAKLREDVKSKLSEEEYTDTEKCFGIMSDFKQLESYISFHKLLNEFNEEKNRFRIELDDLKKQKEAKAIEKKRFSFKSLWAGDPLQERITNLESIIRSEKNCFDRLQSKYELIQCSLDIFATSKTRVANDEEMHDVQTSYLQDKSEIERKYGHLEPNQTFLDIFKELTIKFENRTLDQVIQYKNELLDAVARVFKLASRQKADDFLISRI